MKTYLRNYYRKNNNGFTLIEILAVVIMVGIIAAIASPSLLSLFRSRQIRGSMTVINGAIKEAQRQAIRQSQQCTISIDPTTRIISGAPNGCLLEVRVIDNNIDIRTTLPGTPPNIVFSGKGNTAQGGTIVVSSDMTDTQSCFVIANGLGITRTGDYTGPKNAIDPDDCDSN